LTEAAQIRRGQRAAVVLRDLLSPHFARVGREAAAAEARLNHRRVRADIRQAVAERHDLQFHAARRRAAARTVVIATAAASREQRKGRTGNSDLRDTDEIALLRCCLFHVDYISSYVWPMCHVLQAAPTASAA